jgi:hypothetical protein
MDPLVSLYYYSPVCAAINFVLLILIEGFEPFYHLGRVGGFVLLTNAGIAFALNVSLESPRARSHRADDAVVFRSRRCS